MNFLPIIAALRANFFHGEQRFIYIGFCSFNSTGYNCFFGYMQLDKQIDIWYQAGKRIQLPQLNGGLFEEGVQACILPTPFFIDFRGNEVFISYSFFKMPSLEVLQRMHKAKVNLSFAKFSLFA